MDAFKTHSKVVDTYKEYLNSFLSISDSRIKDEVNKVIMGDGLIPEPLIQFNPSFQKGETLNALIEQNLINSNLPKTFGGYTLYKHQIGAIKIGIQNIGFGSKTYYAMHLKHWAPKDLKLNFYYCKIEEPKIINDIEAALAEHLNPLIGKREK